MKRLFVKHKKLLFVLLISLFIPFTLFRVILPVFGIGRTFSMPTKSMVPILEPQEFFFVNQLTSADLMRDIVAYKALDHLGITRDYINRIAAVAGDTISVENRNLIINGKIISDASFYFYNGFQNENWLGRCKKDYVLGPDEFFLLGDNDKVSYDSRIHGPVKKKDIIGKYSFKLNSIRFFLFTFL